MKQVKIYSTPTCPYCRMLKSYLEQNGIAYTDFDVSVDENARKEMFEITGQMGVPVALIDNEIVIGFDKEKIKRLLGI